MKPRATAMVLLSTFLALPVSAPSAAADPITNLCEILADSDADPFNWVVPDTNNLGAWVFTPNPLSTNNPPFPPWAPWRGWVTYAGACALIQSIVDCMRDVIQVGQTNAALRACTYASGGPSVRDVSFPHLQHEPTVTPYGVGTTEVTRSYYFHV